MKSLNYTIANELGEYDNISRAKQEPTQSVLIRIRRRVEPHYQNYLSRFSSIHNLPANPFSRNHSKNLQNCYHKPTAPLDSLKSRLVSSQTDTFKLLCPYCLISNHSTFDHYIPITEHPVFGVLAKNLVPCCDVCNKKKLNYWRESNRRAVIHFYNDTIPAAKFLHCDLTFSGSIPVLTYRLDLTGIGVNANMRNRISRHFTRLDLLNRYNEAAPKAISDIITDVQALKATRPTLSKTTAFLTAKAVEMSLKCGNNYWEALAYEALGNSKPFLKGI